nr:hypothetical protein [Halorubrum distributum]
MLAHVFETAVKAGADGLVVIVGYEAVQTVDRSAVSLTTFRSPTSTS